MFESTTADSLREICPREWNSLLDPQEPGAVFVTHAWLSALHDSRAASAQTGWLPCYLLLKEAGTLVGAMPLYRKSHSRGEYVFDWGWAEAYARHGLDYYPKLLCAVPFTPVTGPRLLAREPAVKVALVQAALALANTQQASSLHVLFPHAEDLRVLTDAGCLRRDQVQFHWQNAGFGDMPAFLADMRHDARKKINQERRRVREAGVSFRCLRAREIDATHLAFFYQCYEDTYFRHGNRPYLPLSFFVQLHATQPESMLMVLAERAGMPLAAALDIIGANVLYGRWWGAREFVSGLHFETCYPRKSSWPTC